MCTSRPSFEPGRTRAYGPMMQPAPTTLCSSTEFGCTTRARAEAHVAQHHIRPDAHAIAEHHLALDEHVDVDEHIAARR